MADSLNPPRPDYEYPGIVVRAHLAFKHSSTVTKVEGISNRSLRYLRLMLPLSIHPGLTLKEWALVDGCLMACTDSTTVPEQYRACEYLVTKVFGKSTDPRAKNKPLLRAEERTKAFMRAYGTLHQVLQALPDVPLPLLSRSEAGSIVKDLDSGAEFLLSFISKVRTEATR